MKINRNSKLVRFAYWLDRPTYHETGRKIYPYRANGAVEGDRWWDSWQMEEVLTNIPFKTNLCPFFWRAFVLVPIASVIMGPAWFIASGAILVRSWVAPKLSAINLPKIPTARIDRTAEVIAATVDTIIHSTFLQVLWGGLKAMKGRVCPIVRLEAGDA